MHLKAVLAAAFMLGATAVVAQVGAPVLFASTRGVTINANGGAIEHAFTVNEGGVTRFAVEGDAGDGKTDIDFRAASVTVGTLEARDSTTFDFYSAAGASGQSLRVYKPGSSTGNALAIGVNGDLHLYSKGLATNALTLGAWGGSTVLTMLSDAGQLGWASGPSTSAYLALSAGTTGIAPLRFIQGVAPTNPVDGDMWREDNTNTGLKIRVNGVTKTVTLN